MCDMPSPALCVFRANGTCATSETFEAAFGVPCDRVAGVEVLRGGSTCSARGATTETTLGLCKTPTAYASQTA